MNKKKNKKLWIIVGLIVLFIALAMGIFKMGSGKKEYVVGKDITIDEINEFYDTYYNINFNALYQRYYFYVQDGKHFFYHEKREKKNDYGPLNEEDITESGTIELDDETWNAFFEYLKDGTIIKRQESDEDGDAGPWYYLYWDKDKGEIQEYHFVSYGREKEFEQFCISLKGE